MSKDIKIVEAKKQALVYDSTDRKISVCAYCRVSTDKGDQKNSFDAQRQFFEYEFERHANWLKKVIYADEGITGTSLKKRGEFNRMITAANNGEYDLIVTKEVSRFSRNIQDLLNTVVELRKKHVYVYFLTDDINTESPDYREMLIKSGEQAEAESRKTSKRVKWGQRRQMENGVVFGRKEMFGYEIMREANGRQEFRIIPEEAEIVKRVFTMYADGLGTFKIARRLESEGVNTKRFKNGWSNTVILRMLRNEKYVGDLATGKTYTPDFLTHEKKYNRGESAMITITNHHPESAIIERDLWDRVQTRLNESAPSDETKAKHSNRYWCSGKVFCGECGERYVSHIKHLKNGGTHKSWCCWQAQQYGSKKSDGRGCNSQSVNDRVLRQGVIDVINEIIKPDVVSIIGDLKNVLAKRKESAKTAEINCVCHLKEKSKEISETISKLTILLAEGKINETAYSMATQEKEKELQQINDEIASQLDYESIVQSAESDFKEQCERLQKIVELSDGEINDDLFRTFVDRIVVYNDHIIDLFFAGVPNPIRLQYKTTGRMQTYKIEFSIIPHE